MTAGGISIYDAIALRLAERVWENEATRPAVEIIGEDGFKRLSFAVIEEYERVAFVIDAIQRLRRDKDARAPVQHIIDAWDALGLRTEFSDADYDLLRRQSLKAVPF